MNIQEINKLYTEIGKSLSKNNLLDFFEQTEKLIKENKFNVLLETHSELKDVYANILKYSFSEVKDPDRDKVYRKLLQKCYEFADKIKIYLLETQKHFATVNILQEVNFEFQNKAAEIEKELFTDNNAFALSLFFKKIWLEPKLQETSIDLLNKVLKQTNKQFRILKSVLVSALTISNLRCFDKNKTDFLIRFYESGEDIVRHRALTGIVLSVYAYSKRLEVYDDLYHKLSSLVKDTDFLKFLTFVILQFIRSKETEKISQKLQEEILPEVVKFRPKIEDKLKLDDILSDSSLEDKNPDWENIFEDAPELLGKLEQFSKMQIEGSDVFMSAFALLKHFDFFKEPANWFLPFYKENEVIWDAFKFEKESFNKEVFIEGLEKSAFMCNSDKYSFILNIRFMPDMQKNMMLEMFNAELEGMNEILKDDEILNKDVVERYQFTQYIQDLYRFYKLHPYKNEFIDVFDQELDLYNTDILKNIWFDAELFKKIGSLYFEKGYFNHSIQVYKLLHKRGVNEQEIVEKIAYSYQKSGNYRKALEYYEKAELFDAHIKWTTKKIALCHRELGNTQKAIEYYLKAEQQEPENLYVQAHLGHSYLRLKKYEKALQHYFKVEYFAPSNTMILRPIAWCSFVLGKFENAEKYYNKLHEKNEADMFDYLNMGHIAWCTNEENKAVKFYKKAFEKSGNDKQKFRLAFYEDKPYLIKHGVPKHEIALMLDYLLMDL